MRTAALLCEQSAGAASAAVRSELIDGPRQWHVRDHAGPGHFTVVDPDGNPVLIDQHV